MGCNCGRKKAQVTSANVVPASNPPRPDKVGEVAEQLVAASSVETVQTDSGDVRTVARVG